MLSTKPVVANKGGARSSKSYSLAQLFVLQLVTGTNFKMLITRKHLPSLRMTAMKTVIDLLQEYGLYEKKNHNMTDRTYRHGSNVLVFTSIDDPEKMKSAEWTHVWMEEANEFTYEDFMSLKLRMSAKRVDGQQNRMYLSYNPTDMYGWIPEKIETDENVDVIHSTYKDNGFLTPEYVKTLTDLEERDPEYYAVYTLGVYAKRTSTIYTRWSVVPTLMSEYTAEVFGVDFGFNNPMSLTRVRFSARGIALKQEVYQSGLTTGDLIQIMREIPDLKKQPVYCDSAEPDRIEELFRAGFNAFPADKDVENGIDYIKRRDIFITEDSPDIIKEIKAYKWQVDRAGNPTDKPLKFMDHAMDSMRYAVYTHGQKYGLRLFGEKKPSAPTAGRKRRERTSEFDNY
ncbi:MAG: PBSX family phage terminase large subunit [Bacteroidetes bacterium]|nr:PBSX family phage terminase large subunit [Bacteroidota bacterium]